MPWQLLLPKGFDQSDTSKKYPVVVYLHGSGEGGSQNDHKVIVNGAEIFSTPEMRQAMAGAPRGLREVSFDLFGGDRTPAQLDRFGQSRRSRLARSHSFTQELRDGVLEFFVFVHRADFHFVHQVIGKIERGLHFAIFPESWFSVKLRAESP